MTIIKINYALMFFVVYEQLVKGIFNGSIRNNRLTIPTPPIPEPSNSPALPTSAMSWCPKGLAVYLCTTDIMSLTCPPLPVHRQVGTTIAEHCPC